MKKIGISDFRQYKFLSELTFNNCGTKAAFVVAGANQSGRGYVGNLYSLDVKTNEVKELTTFGDANSFMWQGDNLIFAGSRGEKKADNTDFYSISLCGGEAKKIFSVPMNVGMFKKIDDENFAFVSKFDHNKEKLMAMTEQERQEEKDYIIIDELPFWSNGAGFVNKTRKVLYTYNIPTGQITKVSSEWGDVGYVNIQNGEILYTCQVYTDKRPLTNELHRYNLQSKEDQVVIEGGKYNVQSAGYTMGEFAVAMTDMEDFGVGQIADLYFVKDGKFEMFHRPEFGLNNSVGSDCRRGGGKTFIYREDAIYTLTAVHTNSHLVKISKDGTCETLIQGEGTVDMFDINKDGKILYVGMREQKLQEIYDCQNNQITNFNTEVLADKYVAKVETMNIISDDTLIEGFVMKPIDFDENKKYPAIVNVHGGPRAIYGSVFFHEMQYWASEGYFVFFTNPRGSDGRGEQFADLRGLYGTIDFDDLMKFCDEVLEKYPQIDKDNVGITGGSYGGFMTNWAIGNTDRFKAAASQRSLTNWISLTNLADIGYGFDIQQVCGTAWENMQHIWDQSPLKHANKAKTPTLFIHSEEDYRCLLSEGMQMFYAIRNVGCVARMCIFKGENHELSRKGQPIHRVRRLKEITGWFDQYLKGVK